MFSCLNFCLTFCFEFVVLLFIYKAVLFTFGVGVTVLFYKSSTFTVFLKGANYRHVSWESHRVRNHSRILLYQFRDTLMFLYLYLLFLIYWGYTLLSSLSSYNHGMCARTRVPTCHPCLPYVHFIISVYILRYIYFACSIQVYFSACFWARLNL